MPMIPENDSEPTAVSNSPAPQVRTAYEQRLKSSSLPGRILNIAAAIIALGWLAGLCLYLDPVSDFQWYWQGLVGFLELGNPYVVTIGQSVYTPAPGATLPPDAMVFSNLPIFIYLIQPLARLEYRQAQVAWFLLNTLALGGLAVLCVSLSGSRLARRYWGVLALGLVFAPPTWISLQLGQMSILVGLLLVASYAASQRHPRLGGLLFALAVLLRIYPALLFLYFWLRERRAAAIWGIISGLLLVVVSVVIYGPDPYTAFFQTVALSREYPYAAEHNISFFGFFSRMLTDSRYAIPLMRAPLLAQGLTLLSSAVVLGVCVWASRARSDTLGSLLQFSIWLIGVMLLSTTNGFYNLVLLLLPFLAALWYLEQHPNRVLHNLLILATALSLFPPAWSTKMPWLYEAVHTQWGLLLLSPSLYGVLLYFGLLVVIYRRHKRHMVVTSARYPGPAARSDSANERW